MDVVVTPAIPVLCYGRGPVRPAGGERVRTFQPQGVSAITVAVFPSGVRRSDFLSTLLSTLVVAGLLTGATLYFYYHPAPLSRYLATVWPLLFLMLFYLVLLAVTYDEACRQVEFEVATGDVVRLSFGPLGLRRRTWERRHISSVEVMCHVSGSHPRVVLSKTDGGREDLLCPGSAGQLREHADDVAHQLQQALRRTLPET